MKVGFIGLGAMGGNMALNILAKEGAVCVNDVSEAAREAMRAKGAQVAESNAALARACDVVMLSLPNGDVVESVIFSPGGLAEGLGAGKIVVDLSTCDYLHTKAIAAKVEALGAEFLDAPVSGMEARAKTGELSIMCGGKEDAFNKVLPLLRDIGTTVQYLGATGSGQLGKTINQVLYDVNMAALAEILPLAVKMGLDPQKTGDFINAGTGRSYASEYFIPKILAGDFKYGFSLEKAYKDMQSAFFISAKECIPTPVMNAAMATYQMALLEGYGGDYKGAMVKVFEKLNGVEFRKKQ